VLPQRLVPLHVPVAAEDVVDEDVQSTLLGVDSPHECGDLVGVLVVDHQGASAATRCADQISGLLDRLGPVDLGRSRRTAAPPGRVHVGAGARKLDRNGPAGASGRPCDESYPAGQ
jgi:hypothetical protein